MKFIVISFVFILSIVACNPRPSPTLSKEKMADIMLDIAIADQFINAHLPDERDSVRQLVRESLLKVHNLSRNELDTNLYLYMTDYEAFDEVLDLMITKNDSLSESIPK